MHCVITAYAWNLSISKWTCSENIIILENKENDQQKAINGSFFEIPGE